MSSNDACQNFKNAMTLEGARSILRYATAGWKTVRPAGAPQPSNQEIEEKGKVICEARKALEDGRNIIAVAMKVLNNSAFF